ncbi:erythromycin esterase family protein [Paenibacillus albidus]|uniref:erythromycin esterase family protein n=1 Tax=Paenibacillus albidus TaxID=2041023 RepID=UPI0020354A9C|nr:erythromycin esterase family protein [Paenibacillus albidus]
MKVRYPGKKIILWAHNDHLAKNTSDIRVLEGGKWINSFTSMGELLHQKLKDKMYVRLLYEQRKDGLNHKADVSNSWMFKPVYAAEDGMTSEVIVPMSMKFVPKEQFDGLIVVDRVNPPTPAY